MTTAFTEKGDELILHSGNISAKLTKRATQSTANEVEDYLYLISVRLSY